MSARRTVTLLGVAGVLLAAVAAHADDPCASPAGAVSGVVTGSGGAPLAGARVRVQGCLGDPTLTDAAGAFTVAVPAGAQVVAAAAPGYYIGCWHPPGAGDCGTVSAGAAGLTIALDHLPTDDDPAHVFRDPEACQVCHGDVYEQWSRSTMAHTNRNRWVDNLYNGTDATAPPGPPADPLNPPYFAFLARHYDQDQGQFRHGECANCHQPEYVGQTLTDTDFNQFSGAASHGVACDFCHKIVDVDVSPEGIKRPNLVAGDLGLPAKTTMLRSSSQPWLAFGPLDDVTFPGGQDMRASHGAVVRDSRLCAACHEDSAPSRAANGDFLETYDGEASQQTYSEWAASSFAAQGVQCQDCHMPTTGADHFCSRTSNRRDPSQVRSHVFEGTTPDFLRRAVRLQARAAVDGEALAVSVQVTNRGAGHSLPTGVTLRNLILVVSALQKDGTPLAQLATDGGGGPRVPNWGGAEDPHAALADNLAAGRLAGLPGKGYARVLVDEFLAENVLFTEAVRAFDTRIPAGATDASGYRFTLGSRSAAKDVRVETRLYYRRAFKPIADQRKWNVPLNGNPHGTRGDGSDYDENLIVAQATSFLTCRGRIGGVRASGTVAGGRLSLAATLRPPRHAALDPATAGAQVSLGDPGQAGSLLQEDVADFTANGKVLSHAGAASDAVRTLSFTSVHRQTRLAVDLAGLDPAILGKRALLFGVDSGGICFRRTLRCRVRGAQVRCR